MRSPLASYPDDAWAIVRGIFRLTRLLCLVIAIAAPVWAAEVAVRELAGNPSAFDGKEVTVRGVVTARAAKTSHRGAMDCRWGVRTSQALAAFQRDAGLPPTGTPDALTTLALRGGQGSTRVPQGRCASHFLRRGVRLCAAAGLNVQPSHASASAGTSIRAREMCCGLQRVRRKLPRTSL